MSGLRAEARRVARLPVVCLAIVVLAATVLPASGNSASATLSISVTVVRSCSVQTPPTSNGSVVEVSVECRKGAADAVSVGVAGSQKASIQKISEGPNRFSVAPQASLANGNGTVTITIEF